MMAARGGTPGRTPSYTRDQQTRVCWGSNPVMRRLLGEEMMAEGAWFPRGFKAVGWTVVTVAAEGGRKAPGACPARCRSGVAAQMPRAVCRLSVARPSAGVSG